jgi:putative peptidoglycan lipid II flippase
MAKQKTSNLWDSNLEHIKAMFFVVVPFTIALIALRIPIIRLIFQHGNFDSYATYLTSVATLYYALGLLPFSVHIFVAISLLLLKKYGLVTRIYLSSILMKIMLNLVLVKYMDHAGLALSTSLMHWSVSFALVYCLQKEIGLFRWQKIIPRLGKSFVASGVMGGILVWCCHYLHMTVNQGQVQWEFELLQLIGLTLIGIIVYILIAGVWISGLKPLQLVLLGLLHQLRIIRK